VTLKEVLVITACLFLLGIILLPGLAKARDKSRRADCQCRLKQIGLAFRTWEGDFTNLYPMSISTNNGGSKEYLAGSNLYRHFLVMSNEINNPTILNCPSDDRRPAKDWDTLRNNNLSYFVGLDADETTPAMLLAGDRNLVTNGAPVTPGLVIITNYATVTWSEKMHKFCGEVGLADGSVQQTASASLNILLQSSGTNPTRLAVP